MTSTQELAFSNATLGLSADDFSRFILLVLYSAFYLWVAWLAYAQWKAWSRNKIDFYDLLTRIVRAVVLTLVLGFLLR